MARRIQRSQIQNPANVYVAGAGIAIFANGMISTNLTSSGGVRIGPNQRITGQLSNSEQFALTLIFGG